MVHGVQLLRLAAAGRRALHGGVVALAPHRRLALRRNTPLTITSGDTVLIPKARRPCPARHAAHHMAPAPAPPTIPKVRRPARRKPTLAQSTTAPPPSPLARAARRAAALTLSGASPPSPCAPLLPTAAAALALVATMCSSACVEALVSCSKMPSMLTAAMSFTTTPNLRVPHKHARTHTHTLVAAQGAFATPSACAEGRTSLRPRAAAREPPTPSRRT